MVMIPNPLLEPLKSVIIFNHRKIYIDNVIFRMHYIWTVFFLTAFSLLVSSKLYIGNPISCIASPEIKEIANEYCFIHSTFTKGKLDKGKWIYEPVKEDEIYPGIRPNVKGEDADNPIYHTYYQWVWCILLIQAVVFYFPHWCWEKLEGGRVMMLVGNLNLPMLPDDKKSKQRQKILWYFDPNRGYHNFYAFYHAILEVVNLIHVFIEIAATDYIFNFEFSHYGFKLFNLTQIRPYQRVDSLARVFPTITACRLQTGGVAFGQNRHELLCVLPINIVNEKIFIFLWFWFIILVVASTWAVIYRLLTVFSEALRKQLLVAQARYITKDIITIISRDSKYGDWFLVHKLGQNMDPISFGELLVDISEAFKHGGTPRGLKRKERRESTILEVQDLPSAQESPLLNRILEKIV